MPSLRVPSLHDAQDRLDYGQILQGLPLKVEPSFFSLRLYSAGQYGAYYG
jgi:hypothetical protein